MTSSYLVRAVALDGRVRAFGLNATEVAAELQRRHELNPVPAAAVGRSAMGALLLAAASLKEPDHLLTVDIRGGGPIGRIICTADGAGGVRGLASVPWAHAPSREGKLNVGAVVGTDGYLSVTKDLGLRDSYKGTVELQSGEIGDDLAYYLARSEQTPSAVGLGVFVLPDGSVEAAGGFLVQLLPGVDPDEIAAIEQQVAALPHPTALIREGVTPEGILARIFPDGYETLDHYPVAFRCPCSRERFEAALITLGPAELTSIITEEEREFTELVCHFCNEKYHFTRDDMQEILRAAS